MIPMLRILLLFPFSIQAAAYYVATSGLDSNPGTEGSPFLTIQKGVDTAQASDTVLVSSGTYPELVSSARSGTIGSPITLNGQGVSTVWRLHLQHQYLNLINFTVSGATNFFSAGLYVNRGAHFCIISNNIFDLNYKTNVYPVMWNSPSTLPFNTDAGSDNLVVSNTFTHGRGVPMLSIYGDRNVIRGNRLVDGEVVDWFRVWGRTNHIVANLCSNNFASAVENHPDFIQTFGLGGAGSWGHIIENNIVMASGTNVQLGLMNADGVPEIGNWTFRNNLFLSVPMQSAWLGPNMTFENNLFYRCSSNYGGHVLLFGTEAGGNGAHGSKVRNNVFLDCGDSRTNVGWYSFTTNLTNVAADYNFVSKNNYVNVESDPLMRAVGDPGGWSVQVWWEDHGINGGNPQLANESTLNFHPQASSLLIGAATNLNALFTTDFDGIVRGAAWDIGPYEFVQTLTNHVTSRLR